MMHIIRPAAIATSLAVHAALLIQAGGESGVSKPVAKAQSVIRLSFNQPAPTPVPESIPEEQPQEEIPDPQPKPKPVKKAIKKAKELVQQEPQKPAPPVQQSAAVATDQAQAPQLDEGVIQSKTKAYLAAVVAHIERHKWYPKAARRRGIEGSVDVEFLLLPGGEARAVIVSNGPQVLLAAARKTVEQASPLPAPPAEVHCPIKCNFRMQFALDAI